MSANPPPGAVKTQLPGPGHNETCVLPNARWVSDTVCDCNPGYAGDDCQEELLWWRILLFASVAAEVLIMLIFTLWATLKLYHHKKVQHKTLKKLVPISLILVSLGCLSRAASVVISRPVYTLQYQTREDAYVYVFPIFYGLCVGLWVLSFNLLVGFWMDMLSRKLKVKMKKSTSILAICFGVFAMGLGVGQVILLSAPSAVMIASIIIVVPLLADIVLIIVFVVQITRRGKRMKKEMSEHNRGLHNYARKLFLLGLLGWVLLVVVGVLSATYYAEGLANIYVLTSAWLPLCVEVMLLWILLKLGDRNGSIFILIKAIRDKNPNYGSTNSTTYSSGSSNGSSSRYVVRPSETFETVTPTNEPEESVSSSSSTTKEMKTGSERGKVSESASVTSSGSFSSSSSSPAK